LHSGWQPCRAVLSAIVPALAGRRRKALRRRIQGVSTPTIVCRHGARTHATPWGPRRVQRAGRGSSPCLTYRASSGDRPTIRNAGCHDIELFQVQRAKHLVGPGRRIYPRAVAKTIAGVDAQWIRLRRAFRLRPANAGTMADKTARPADSASRPLLTNHLSPSFLCAFAAMPSELKCHRNVTVHCNVCRLVDIRYMRTGLSSSTDETSSAIGRFTYITWSS
jgi:hypothetical protein